MRLLKLTVLPVLFCCCCLLLASCEKETGTSSSVVSNFNINLSRSINVPTSNNATGRMEATLDKANKTMTYKLTWNGLSSSPVAIHIHGLAGQGMIALPTPLGPFANGIAQNITGFPATTSGTLTGTLFVDGVLVKEADLVAGQYYIDIHTVNYSSATYPSGEIRGQISFAN